MVTVSRIYSAVSRFDRSNTTSPFHNLAATADPAIPLVKLLNISIETNSVKLSHQSHARARVSGLTQHPLIAQKLIFSCCQLKRPSEAKLVFNSLLVKSPHACNTLLSGYGKNQLFWESLKLFKEMCRSSVLPLPDDFTFSVIFKIIGDWGEVFPGRMIHGRSIRNGLVLDTVVGNSLMSMYSKYRYLSDCLKMFDEIPLRNASSWNAVISAYAKANVEDMDHFCGTYRLWDFVKEMQSEGVKFDAFTVSTILSVSSWIPGRDDPNDKCGHGRVLHCFIVKNGWDLSSEFDSDVHLGCCLIDMYSKDGKVGIGRRVFDRLKCKNVFTWTAMISGHAHNREFDEALYLFREMQWEDAVEPNKVSLIAILPACSSSAGLIGSKQVHGFAFRREFNYENSLCNTLIDTYSKCGDLKYAARVFWNECLNKDSISWSSIISAYGLHGQGQQAVTLFDNMLQNGFTPDTTVVTGVLSACCRSGLVTDGMRIYNSVVNACKIKPTVEICACMVDMFGRSGHLNHALHFIKTMPVEPGPSIWGSLLSASALHGNFEIQDLAYRSLIQIEPDNSSNYVSLSNLSAASRRWDVVAQVRMAMREKGLKKSPGSSWISLNGATHNFFVADKSHPCYGSIHVMLDELVSAMKLTCCSSDFVYLMEEPEGLL